MALFPQSSCQFAGSVREGVNPSPTYVLVSEPPHRRGGVDPRPQSLINPFRKIVSTQSRLRTQTMNILSDL